MALLGQKAENQYCGVNCGIMDQFASAMGKKNHAIFLKCDDLTYDYAPIELDGMKIPYGAIAKIYEHIYNTAPEKRKCIKGMDISRADIILAGVTPAKVLMDMIGSPCAYRQKHPWRLSSSREWCCPTHAEGGQIHIRPLPAS